MTKRIVLCADDYGQASSISSGIIDLIKQDRLSATSCLVNAGHWPSHAAQLKSYQGQIDIGLHFNLTEGEPLSAAYKKSYGERFFSLPQVMFRAISRSFDQEVIAAECEAQILRFSESLGFLPDFVDGHQHIHQFPIIRDAVLAVYERHLRASLPYVRLAKENLILKKAEILANIKKMTINGMGAKIFKKQLLQNNIPYNQSFAGIYPFAKAQSYDAFFCSFLKEIGQGGIIMCHPGKTANIDDPIAKARMREYQYFTSTKFLEDCDAYRVKISRFSQAF